MKQEALVPVKIGKVSLICHVELASLLKAEA